jgi:hypothetical protein
MAWSAVLSPLVVLFSGGSANAEMGRLLIIMNPIAAIMTMIVNIVFGCISIFVLIQNYIIFSGDFLLF